MSLLHRTVLFFTVLLFFAIIPLFARDVTITVVDTELKLPLEGAVIRSWDGMQYICDENGRALVSVPDERQVVVQAAYPGYENGRLIIAPGADAYTLSLRLSGIMEGRELVVEAARPGTSETQTGRSVAISGRDIAQTAEIGVVEDVMNSVRLLPGVGYTGLFNAQPSIRGGDPGDMRASLDGFYVFNPYHWGGSFSIFDPRMVESAQLSHGVFSSRYGHTISGLLEVTTKKPSATETQFELGVNTSAANVNLSVPLAGKGGILFMGRITYYDPIIALAQQLAKVIDLEELQAVNAIRVAPYIRSTTVTGNYRFFDDLEFKATGFWGMDGVGVSYENSSRADAYSTNSNMDFDWTNYQGFINAGLSWNPRNDMLLKFTAGAGYEEAVLNGNMRNTVSNKIFSAEYIDKYGMLFPPEFNFSNPYSFNTRFFYNENDLMFNTQGRIDYDWELGNGFLLAAGVQEMFTRFSVSGNRQFNTVRRLHRFKPSEQEDILNEISSQYTVDPVLLSGLREYIYVSVPIKDESNADNQLFATSGYGLAEYHTPGNRFRTELGLRVDHYYLLGKGISLQSKPALNPRLNLDFNVFKNMGYVQSLDLSAGTGLFSSMNNSVFIAEEEYNINEIKPNRSLTSVLGTRLEFLDSLIFNIEGYYKYTFDRMYISGSNNIEGREVQPYFNGEGRVWGIDLLLQKMQARYWDGWISYSFSWAKYHDPNAGDADGNSNNNWYFPSYHRFHNLNLILNVKPVQRINIYTRLGFASGVQISRRIGSHPESYPVYMYEYKQFIEMYYWPSERDEDHRTTPSLNMDVKFSFFGKNNAGKVRYEVYFAIENVLGLLYSAQGNTSFNSYTGEVNTGSTSATYDMPIPIPSFGFKISY